MNMEYGRPKKKKAFTVLLLIVRNHSTYACYVLLSKTLISLHTMKLWKTNINLKKAKIKLENKKVTFEEDELEK